MGLPATAKQLAVDSNLLFDLAAKSDFAHTFREVFQELGYSLLVPPTVVQELSFMGFARKPQNAQQKVEQDLATIALKCLLSWKISPFNLVPTGHALTEQFVKKLQHLGHLPDDEFNDGLILAETSLAQIPVLVTNDSHLAGIDPTQLRLCFETADLRPVVVARPGEMLKAVR